MMGNEATLSMAARRFPVELSSLVNRGEFC